MYMGGDMCELISVIVPVYNSEAYVGDCIKCIQNQSYGNFELILVNDGSCDGSLKVCKLYEENDRRIKVFDQPNGGASVARNTGLRYANGKYIVFLDSDDYVSNNYLENLYLAIKEGNYDIVQCNMESTLIRNKELEHVEFKKEDVAEITKIQALNDRLYKVSVCAKIYSAYIFEKFKFKEGSIYEDDASYYIFVDRAKKIAILDEILYYYYLSNNSVMRNGQKDKSTSFIEISEERIDYFKKENNIPLMEGSYGRYCLVLMLNIAKALKFKTNKKDIQRFIMEFKKYYSLVMHSKYVRTKDKIMFTLFRVAPQLVGRCVGEIYFKKNI